MRSFGFAQDDPPPAGHFFSMLNKLLFREIRPGARRLKIFLKSAPEREISPLLVENFTVAVMPESL